MKLKVKLAEEHPKEWDPYTATVYELAYLKGFDKARELVIEICKENEWVEACCLISEVGSLGEEEIE